jgi:hypothetical protein
MDVIKSPLNGQTSLATTLTMIQAEISSLLQIPITITIQTGIISLQFRLMMSKEIQDAHFNVLLQVW